MALVCNFDALVRTLRLARVAYPYRRGLAIMCQRCADLAQQYFPELNKAHHHHLLMGATAFPLCDPEYLEVQLQELRRKADAGYFGDDIVGGACAWADADTTAVMELQLLETQDWGN